MVGTKRTSSVTSLSWIPSEAVEGFGKLPFTVRLSHYDSPPPDRLTDLEALRLADRFRFANELAAWAEFDEAGRPAAFGHDGGVFMGATTVRLGPMGGTFAGVTMPVLRGEPVVGDDWVRFTQTCGGRTALPLPRSVPKPPFVRLQAPLVWSTLALTLYADGRVTHELTGASPFPRHWVYDAAGELVLKTGLTRWAEWTAQLSPRHTPWGDEDSPALVVAAESALERELSGTIMRAGRRPEVRSLAEGDVLVREGSPGDALYLLLDGILAVEVGGSRLAEVGPGAVVGERALIEGGTRTATLVAVTPVRVARAAADAVEVSALAELAGGHRREDAPAEVR